MQKDTLDFGIYNVRFNPITGHLYGIGTAEPEKLCYKNIIFDMDIGFKMKPHKDLQQLSTDEISAERKNKI
ncbi:MAG: hypothetical protein ACYCQI_01260 [Gammaproteobacteria bacterium]